MCWSSTAATLLIRSSSYLHNRNNNTYIRIGLTIFADFLLSFFVEIQDKSVSGVGCRSPPHNLDFSKKFRLEETEMAYNHGKEEQKWRLWKEVEEEILSRQKGSKPLQIYSREQRAK